jgi:hypothetical protein
MMITKEFDCVEYKCAIQERHIVETQGLTPDQRTLRRRQWLEESDNPAARLWREMSLEHEVETVR